MVFEHLASFFIDKYLGNYIEDFDSDQLKLNLWNGDITLENVYLKTNSLNDLSVPFEIITGYIEKLKIHIPWKHLYSDPTKIELNGFYLLLSPKTDINYSSESAEEEEYKSKMKEVNKVEQFRREREEYELKNSHPHHKDTFFERLQFHILRNIEIEIKNVHIAFDDKTSKLNPFQFGLILNSIKLKRTNNQWENIQSKDDDDNIIYKFGEINDLSIYWNSNIKSRLDLNKDEILDELKSVKEVKYPKMNSIVQPLNVRAKLKIAKTAEEQEFEEAVLDVQLDLEEIYFNINQNQYSDLLDLLEFQNYLNTKKKYIKYYPIINENPDEKLSLRRWKFAYQSILHEFVRPRLASFKWENIRENLNRYSEYHQIYLDQLNHHFIKQHKQRAKELEKQIDLFNLIYIRRTAQIEYKKTKIEEKSISWWDKLTNWWNSDSNEDNNEFESHKSLTNEEKSEFYRAIGYKDETSKEDLVYPKEYIDLKISIKLNLIELNIWSLIKQNDSNLKVITRLLISNSSLEYQRRPEKDDFLIIVSINSFEMFGIDSCLNEEILSRPILIQPFNLKEKKLIYLEFESNPLNNHEDYQIKILSQPLQITYHAMTINKLIQCFLPDRHYDLEGIKEAAYSIYTDIKHRTQFLVNENVKRIKDLDINIHFQSIYFILPEYGYLNNSSSLICLDFGHLTFKGGNKNIKNEEEEIYHDANTFIDEQTNLNDVPLKIQLENVQLLYLNQKENWIEYLLKEDSPSHLIKPITLTLDLTKSIIIDDPQIPIWKANGEISSIECEISDTRLFGFVKLLETIPYPQSPSQDEKDLSKKSLKKYEKHLESTKEKSETIENMTPVKNILYEEEENESNCSEQQLIQLQLSFQISKIEILFKRALIDLSDYTEDFCRISLLGIVSSIKIETYHIQFNAHLQDFIIKHEQFILHDKQIFKILSKKTNSNILTMNCLLTSTSNPSFASSPYNSIENQIYFQLNEIILNVQLEVLTSIIHFINNFKQKLNKLSNNKTIKSNSSELENQSLSSSSSSSSFKIDFCLNEITIFIGNTFSQILYIELKRFNGYLLKTNIQILLHFILNDFSVIDLYPKSLYQYIIYKENQSNHLIQLDLSLFLYPSNFVKIKSIEESFLKGYLEKVNIVFLSKHIDLILSIINSFETKQTNEEVDKSSNNKSFFSSTFQSYQNQSLQFYFDFVLNGPEIVIPFNSYSYEKLLIYFGKLKVNTNFDQSLFIEKHEIIFENLSISRFIENEKNVIYLFECSPLIISINRYLRSEYIEDQDQISIKIQWDSIHFKLGKYDYAAINNILQQNFKENIFYKIPKIENNEQQQQDFDELKVISKDKSSTNESSIKIRLDFKIKEIVLTLYLEETNNISSHHENNKFVSFTIQIIEAFFQQSNNSISNGRLEIQHLFSNDFKQNNKYSTLINKGFNVEQNSPLLVALINNQNSTRSVNVEMESLIVLISSSTINSMKELFNSEISPKEEIKSVKLNNVELDIPSPAKSISQYKQLEHQRSSSKSLTNEKNESPKRPSSSSSDVETNVEFIFKPCQLVLIDDPKSPNSGCLVLNFSLSMLLVNNEDSTKISSSVKDFSFYGSNCQQLNDLKLKYSVIDPSQIDAMIIFNSEEQKIDLNIGDLSINIDPILIRTFISLTTSINKEEQSKPKEGREKVNCQTIFHPKPFKDSTFWFIEDYQQKKELIEEIDLLELTTGEPSQKKNQIKQKEKEKQIQINKYLKQQLIINLKIIQIKLELGEGSSTRPVLAFCLSNIFADIQNWSTDILISSAIQIELALFNDHLLAWEPLIEPIIDEKGIIISPWTIYSQTIQDQDDENDEEYRYLLNEESKSSKEEEKESEMKFNANKLILIHSEDLLNLTLTKTTVDLLQRLQIMFNEAYQKSSSSSDDDEEQSMLSINNQTGYIIHIDQIIGLQFPHGEESKEKSLDLKINDSVHLTIPNERLEATHLPAINEQVEKRKQQFQLEIEEKRLTVDINQTWRRVYELFPSSNPLWPIQLLCDSQICQERRRIILSSIIKVSNRTLMPLIVLDAHSIETNQFNEITKIDVNEEYYLPIELLYSRTTTRIYFTIQQENSNSEINDFLSFDWSNESTTDRILKLNNGKQAHYVIYKEEIEAYSENTDEPIRKCFNIYVKLALHILNLLPIDIQCSIDNIENASLKSGEFYHSTQGNKKSILIFTIPSYKNSTWISQSVDLNLKGHGIHNEHIIQFHDQITNEILRMILRVDTYRGSYRASFYSPYWIVNATDLKFQFKIENDKTFVDIVDKPYLICPKKCHNESDKIKGYIRLFSIEEDENISEWSEGFSLNVIKSTGITSCQVKNDRNYLICIDIVTSSFGMTKIVTLAPSTSIINNSTIDIEVNEQEEENNWKLVKSNQVEPYWPRYLKEGVMYVRYKDKNCSPTNFSIKEKHQTLLRMDNLSLPAIHLEVTTNDYDGYKIIFEDYQIGDAPILIVNALLNQNISFCQKDDLRTQLLPSQYYVYYTWIDTFKPKELTVSTKGYTTNIQINSSCGIINKDDEDKIYYAIFDDGPQTVLMFSNDTSIIESFSYSPLINESMKDYIKLSLHSIGISVINDIKREDLLYITINPSKEVWCETKQFNLKPIGYKINQNLEEHYQTYIQQSEDKQQSLNKFQIDKNRNVSFDDCIAEISNSEGHIVHVKRQSLDGLIINYRWSLTNKLINLKINNFQVDNQLLITLFPTIIYPIVSKSSLTDIPVKSFIELSIVKTESLRSKTIQIKYFKFLIQEFVARIDQGLILGIISFFKKEKNLAGPSINIDDDLKYIDHPLERIIKNEIDNKSNETKVYFDYLHLSPLKIHVSFSMHGSEPNDQLLSEYPLVGFLLEILNIAEVQDVILKLNYFQRKNDRYTITKLTKEMTNHYENQFLKQIHVVVLGLDVLGNPFGVLRGVKQGVQAFFYEPYQGAMEGPVEFVEGVATGTKDLLSSVIGGAADALSKVTQSTSKGLATLTLDKDYQNARIQRKEIQSETTPEIVSSGKNVVKDVILGVKGVVKKPVEGAKHGGTKGFVKGLGKGFLGLVGRPASGVADLTSTSFKLIKRVTTHEEIVHRLRNPRHVGRDGLVRPSIANETLGIYLFNKFGEEKRSENEGYIAHINSTSNPPTLFFATTKRILFLIENESSSNEYQIAWDYHYKEIKGSPIVKFQPNFIEITLKETNALGITKKDSIHVQVVPYDNIGEARYIVDKMIETTNALEL